MATAANPLAAAVQAKLAQMQGGAAPGAPGAPGSDGGSGGGGMPPSSEGGAIGQQLASQSSELHGADPGMLLKQLKKIREALGVMFIQTFQSVPNVAGHVSKTMGTLDRAIKEAESAAQTASAVRPPVGFSLAQQSPETSPQGVS